MNGDDLAQVTQSLSCVACVDVALWLAVVLVFFIFGEVSLVTVVGTNLVFTLLHLTHVVLIISGFVVLFSRYLYSRTFFLVAAGIVLAIDSFILVWRTILLLVVVTSSPTLLDLLQPLVFFLFDAAFFTTAVLYFTTAGRETSYTRL